MDDRLTADIELAVLCCRWPPSDEGDNRIREIAGRVSRWTDFDAVVRRNRVSPLVHRALNRAGIDLPENFQTALAKRAAARAQRALFMARESVRLQSAFDAEGIPMLVLKGSPLGILAYGDLGLKEARDIDVLVERSDCARILPLLAGLGFRLSAGDLSPAQFLRYVEHAKEAQFRNAEKDLTIDLHWKLVETDGLMAGVDARGPVQSVALPGGALRTLADEPLFAFLCIHGTHHAWGRLKWLADLNAFVGSRPGDEIARLLEASSLYGATRSASVALLLCHRLFGLPLHDSWDHKLERGWISRMLQQNAVANLTYRSGLEEHQVYSAPWFRLKAGQLFVGRGLASALAQGRHLWNSPDDRARIVLPPRLAFAYHLFRVPLWLARMAGIQRPQARLLSSRATGDGPPPL